MRRAIQNSKESLRKLSEKYSVTEKNNSEVEEKRLRA
jgi:hypothetical protein